MDHVYIEEQALIERYHRDDLDADEASRFEAHFIDCQQCLEQLELASGFLAGLRTVAAEDTVQGVRLGIFAWLMGRGGWKRSAPFLAILLLSLGLPLAWLLGRSGAGFPDGGTAFTPEVFLLSTLRTAPGEPAAFVLELSPGQGVALAIDPGRDPRFESYRVILLDSTGRERLRESDLLPNALEVLLLTLPDDFLVPGEYRLLLKGLLPDGSTVDLEQHVLRVTIAR